MSKLKSKPVQPKEFSYDIEDILSNDSSKRDALRKKANKADFSRNLMDESKLIEMAGAVTYKNNFCQEAIYKGLVDYHRENRGYINLLVNLATHNLLINSGRKNIKLFEREGRKEADKIIRLGKKLYEALPKINYTRRPKPRSLEETMYHWLHDVGKTHEEWTALTDNLDYLIKDLEQIRKQMSPRNKSRPRTLDGLKCYMSEIATMYEATTDKKFTVNKLVKEKPQNNALAFAFAAVEAIYSCTKERYEPQEIYTACTEVLKIRKSHSKMR